MDKFSKPVIRDDLSVIFSHANKEFDDDGFTNLSHSDKGSAARSATHI